MTALIKFPGTAVALRQTQKQGHALISATLRKVASPLEVAGQCGNDLRSNLRHVNDNFHRGDLVNAKINHGRMLSRAALVRAAETALFPVVFPNMIASPVVGPETALAMLSVLLRSVGKVKNVETDTLLAECVRMFDPISDAIGDATGLWRPISKHPVVLALAIRKLINCAAFTSGEEFRRAMVEARGSIVALYRDAEHWLDVLRNSDRCVFEHDRTAWNAAYENVGSDVIAVMQDPHEEGWEEDDESEPPSPRWAALEALRLAKATA